ncbi:MAG: response regulator [Deltaproteobacteria bacterium]|nr:response regulator [Deltaproteobacteria bacterium]
MGILIVDDEAIVRRSLEKVLKNEGYRIFLAEDGYRAIDIVKERQEAIETVISDYKMPGLDGIETLTAIGRLNPEVTKIILTGYATMEIAIDSMNAGIEGFLTKPFSNLELRAKVREFTLKKRLKQFVSESVFTEIQRCEKFIHPMRRRVSVLFSDIRGFTTLSESIPAEELSEFLNRRYFTPVDEMICSFGGTLDKHIGDGVMGIFGAPVADDTCGLKAVQCALGIQERLENLADEADSDATPLSVGIGIGTGEVMAGVFGSSRKKEYTAFGPPVNMAARLEGIAQKRQILICGETFAAVRSVVRCRRLENVKLKGIKGIPEVYEILGGEPPRGERSLT